jgi:hypothetical protein
MAHERGHVASRGSERSPPYCRLAKERGWPATDPPEIRRDATPRRGAQENEGESLQGNLRVKADVLN